MRGRERCRRVPNICAGQRGPGNPGNQAGDAPPLPPHLQGCHASAGKPVLLQKADIEGASEVLAALREGTPAKRTGRELATHRAWAGHGTESHSEAWP